MSGIRDDYEDDDILQRGLGDERGAEIEDIGEVDDDRAVSPDSRKIEQALGKDDDFETPSLPASPRSPDPRSLRSGSPVQRDFTKQGKFDEKSGLILPDLPELTPKQSAEMDKFLRNMFKDETSLRGTKDLDRYYKR